MSEKDLDGLLRVSGHGDVDVYLSNQSFVGSNDGGTAVVPFVQVWNSGTPEYDRSAISQLIEQLPFQSFLDRHVSGDASKKCGNRGNYQFSIGFTAQSFKPWTPAVVRRHYGAAVPALRSNTLDPEMVGVSKLLTQICSLMGVYWLDEDVLRNNPLAAEADELVQEELGNGCRVPLWTWHALPVEDRSSVHAHMDSLNGEDPYSQVVMLDQILTDDNGK